VSAVLASRWAEALADAVQHAHERGILHRDIKPDNVILAPGSSAGELVPRLTDFGLAKLLEEVGEETRSEPRVGTLAYMSPEQATGRRGEVGPAADVYALGATLYEVLTGGPPFRGEGEAETLRLIAEAEPMAPRSLRPGLPRDLETICLKCLRKEPGRRYESAAALRDDLRRFLEGRPIVGRPLSMPDRAWGWARRRPGVSALLALVVVLAGVLAVGLAGWVAWLERHRRELELHVARADRNAEEARKQSRIAEDRRRLADRHHHAEGLRRAREALDARQLELAQDILHDLRPAPDAEDPRGFAWRYLWRQAHREFSQLWGHEAIVRGWTATPDARTLATWDLHGKVLIWDVAPGMALDRPRATTTDPGLNPESLRFSADGRYLAGSAGTPSRPEIRLIDPATGHRVARLEIEGPAGIPDLRFDRQGRRLAAVVDRGERAGEVWWWDLADRDAGPLRRPIGPGAAFARFSADGRFLAVVRDGRILLCDPWSGSVLREVGAATTDPPGLTEFSADGSFAATHLGRSILLWQTETGREVGRYDLDGGLRRFLLSPRGGRLAVLDDSGYVTVFDRSPARRHVLTSGTPRQMRGHWLSFSADETLLAIGIALAPGGSQPPEVWDIDGGRRVGVFPGRSALSAPSFFPGSRSLIVTGGTGPRIWRLDPADEPDAMAGHAAEAWAASWSPDGRVLATGSDDTREPRTIRLWDPATGRLLPCLKGHTATVASLAFSPDGRLLASGSLDSGAPGHPNVILWDAAAHRRLASLVGHTDRVRSVAFSPDGRTLATASDDATARLWDVAGRTTRAVLAGHTKNLTGLAFSPDGRTLATASNDATVRLWDVGTARTRAILRDMGDVNAVAFAPDGSMLASANLEGGIKLWDPAAGTLLQTIRSEADQLRCLAFSPGGRNIAAAGKGKVVRIWDVVTGQELLELDGHKAQINALAFAPDGTTLASCSHDGAVKLWRARPIEAIPSH
jgi:WD40 repeat protein